LTHYSYITTNEGFFKKIKDKTLNTELRDATNNLLLLQDSGGKFNDIVFHQVEKVLNQFKIKEQYINYKFVLNNVTTFMKNNEMLPAIFFVFSRKLCEKYAQDITVNLLEDDSKIPYITANEIEQFMRKKLPNYNEYLQLPEYIQLIKLMEKGIGYHHSGMLPILRELVEFSINENKIKLLFATESFGIGLNCAIKTTVFTQLKKHDELNERFLFSHEYLQMAGRAGRRGIDEKGYVIHLNNIYTKHPSLLEYKNILKCEAPKMKSKNYISYNTFLEFKNIGSGNNSKSILEYEIDEQIKNQKLIITELQNKLEKKEQTILMCKTPQNIIYKYIELIKLKKNANLNHKKQKENEREIDNLHDNYNTIKNDANLIDTFEELKMEYQNHNYYLSHLENYIENQLKLIGLILKSQNYINIEANILDNKWLIASNIHEIHPLIITDYIINNKNYLNSDNLLVEDVIDILSLWSDIKIKDDLPKKDNIVPNFVEEIYDLYRKYMTLENEYNIDHKTNINDDMFLKYNGQIFKLWATGCNNIDDAKIFIEEYLYKNSISLGDFTKACLKIVAISKELEKILGSINDFLLLAQKFGQIERLLCKFIVTSQSLYIN
jgi:superfamily II RNA helicase